MHFLLNLLRIKGLYMFRALIAHPQEVLHKGNLVYCVGVMSVGCTRIMVEMMSDTPVPLYYAAPEVEWNWCLLHQFHSNSGAAN
jgi:hypothetical protein